MKNCDTHDRIRLPGLLIQAGCGGGALALTWLAQLPGWTMVVLGVLLGTATIPELMPTNRRCRARLCGLAFAWICTAVLAGGLLLSGGKAVFWEGYYACLIWLIAAVIGLACRDDQRTVLGRHWKLLFAVWSLAGGVLWIGAAWLQNESIAFHLGLLFLLAWLILVRIEFPMPMSFKLGLHTLILFIVALPLVDLFIPAPRVDRAAMPLPTEKVISPVNAKKDPAKFAFWWSHYLEQWDLMARDVFMPDPEGILPFRLRPSSQGYLFHSRISINSLGMRGPEILAEKGNVYRIVALGESTTFGCTLNPEDQPWPELLEQMIRERIHPSRPVEVINAGVPAYNLKQNVHRLDREILPLKPDMILSYHGYNGFKMLTKSLPHSKDERPAPIFKPRPLRLLAQVEYRLKMDLYKAKAAMKAPPLLANFMDTEYARAYEQLIQTARTNRIRLVLGNFSMAVNQESSPEMVSFYQAGFPIVRWEIRANRVHSLIVNEMVKAHPEVGFIDMNSNLDGSSEKYIDLVHFTQSGRQQLAETIFAGIRKDLEADLLEGAAH